MGVKRKFWLLMSFFLLPLLAACAQGNGGQVITQPITSDSISVAQQPAPSSTLTIPNQRVKPSPTPTKATSTYHPAPTPTNIPGSGTGTAPWGQPPALTAEEIQLTQQLFNQINHDRAVRGLYPFIWNPTLAGGARLHDWNMYHCGFSHTCPDGLNQCTRIANEGFTFTDCGECIGLAGPSSPPWDNIYAVQESMMNEGPTGWHFIHLTSVTLHRIGVGIYIDPRGWAWFTEDIVS